MLCISLAIECVLNVVIAERGGERVPEEKGRTTRRINKFNWQKEVW